MFLIQILGGQLEQLKVCGLNYDRVKKVKKKKKDYSESCIFY